LPAIRFVFARKWPEFAADYHPIGDRFATVTHNYSAITQRAGQDAGVNLETGWPKRLSVVCHFLRHHLIWHRFSRQQPVPGNLPLPRFLP
jgi:hypothetical protein